MFASCGKCIADDEFECVICLELLCIAQRGGNICGTCRSNPAVVRALPKNDSGWPLHPLTMAPLRMCACGLMWNTICGLYSVSIEPGPHKKAVFAKQ